MKALIATILVVTFVGLVVCFKAGDASPTPKLIQDISELATGKVLGIHHVTLKEGVDESDFARFIVEEGAAFWDTYIPGVQVMIMQGDRGANVGEYILIYLHQSLHVRDLHFPGDGQETAVWTLITEATGSEWERIYAKYQEYVASTEYTDYVELVR